MLLSNTQEYLLILLFASLTDDTENTEAITCSYDEFESADGLLGVECEVTMVCREGASDEGLGNSLNVDTYVQYVEQVQRPAEERKPIRGEHPFSFLPSQENVVLKMKAQSNTLKCLFDHLGIQRRAPVTQTPIALHSV